MLAKLASPRLYWQDFIGRPSTVDSIKYVESDLLLKCPITKEDIMCMEDILRSNLGRLKGKMTKNTPERVILNTIDNLPHGMLDKHGNNTIAVINIIPFMMTMSRAIHFSTVEMIKNETKSTIIKSIQQIIHKYYRRGFRVKHILGDSHFECIRKYMELKGINVNITGREDVPEI